MAVQFDADSIKTRIINRLKSKEAWADILFYSANMRLIDIFAEELAYDMQYDEILSTESKWSLAQQISSLLASTQFFNYIPYRKQGSSGFIKVGTSENFDTTYALNIDIPKYTLFSNGDDIQFAASESITLNNSDYSLDVPVIQGTPKEVTFTAAGNEYETFTVINDSIENSLFDIYVNGELWDSVDNIREAESSESLVYELKNLNDFSGIKITFGNDSFGKKLSNGDVILFKYIETLGLDGNIESSSVITTIESTLYDSNGNSVDMYCTNDSTLIGGTNSESLESIRVKAPKSFQTGDRAISKDDYKSIAEGFNFIKKATCWGETEVNEDLGNLPGTYIAVEENVVHISAINTSDDQVTDAQITEIRTELNNKKPPTDIVVFEDVSFIYILFTVAAYIANKKYTLSNVKTAIESTLLNTYSIDNLDFKEIIRYSDYTSLIDQVSGVDYHESTISFYKFEKLNTAYTADINIEMEDITPGTVKVYIKDNTLISSYSPLAHDDGVGNFVAESGYTVSASSINYNNGIGNIIITSGLSSSYGNYSIKIEFEVTNTSIIPTKRYQMISYGDSNITISYE